MLQQARALEQQLTAWRRDFHQHPELGFEEVRTAGIVADELRWLGLRVQTGVGRTGVVARLGQGSPVIGIRADMDALPLQETNAVPYASQVPNTMHACGHDAHTAILMGAAEVLAGMRDRIAGTILFVFQPAEEGVAGEEAGARLMLKEGAFSPIRPDAIFGLHVEPGRVGEIDARPGPMLSSATGISIRLKGRQTHAGRPWEGTDLVNLAADVVKSLNTIAARQVNVFEFPNVVSIGALRAGNRGNILPGEATLDGTIRTFDLARRDDLKARIRTTVAGLAAGYDAEADVNFEDVALVTGNDPALLETVMPALKAAAPNGVNTDALMRGAAEDFSFFQAEVPGLYYILGATPPGIPIDKAPTNHSDRFDIDEAVLPIGVKAHVLTALAFLDSRAN